MAKINLKVLAHPIVLLIVGAIISSFLIPFYTRAWQDHQKELELKTELVSENSGAVTPIIISAQTIKSTTSPSSNYYIAYQNWETSSAIVGSKLQAYFHDTSLPSEWNNYSKILTDFVFLSISSNTCIKMGYVEEIQKYFSVNSNSLNKTELQKCQSHINNFQNIQESPFPQNSSKIDWNILINEKYGPLSASWSRLEQIFVSQRDDLIDESLRSAISAFS
jgi:hypothetical protein